MGEELKKKNFSNINEKIKKAKLTEKAINLIEKERIAVDEAFQTYGLKISPFSYPRIYRKYKEGGLEGIIDTRGGKRVEKVTPSIKDFIISQKSVNGKLTAKQIRKKVWEEFDDMKARIIQHEYDHIEGVLFTDHLNLKLYGIWIAFTVWMILRGGILVVIFKRKIIKH